MAEDADHDDYCLQQYEYRFLPEILKGKVAFITGGGSGIGFRIAELLMRHGCDTAIGSRRMDKLEQSAKNLKEGTGRECLPVQMDVRKYEIVKVAIEATVKKFGRLDILVNNAAGNFICPAASLSSNAFRNVIDIDAVGSFNATKAAYEVYFKDHGGTIVSISATLYYTGDKMQLHAGAAKAAVDAMTRHLAVEWGPQNIRINSLAPGPVEGTVGMRKLGGIIFEDHPELKEKMQSSIPLGRLCTRTEMAEAVIFLACDLSSYMTGAVMVVDGGFWMRSLKNML